MITDSLWEFCTAGKIKFGDGAVEEAGWEAKRLGGSRILVITDGGVAKAGLLDKVKRSLKKENLEVGVFDCVQPDPPLQVYDDCLRYARQEEYDLVIGLGGGSSMDVAKVTATLLTQGGEPLDYVAKPTGRGLPIKKGLPNIAVPTTSGTGSEVSPVAVITLPEKGLKVGISNNYIRPDVALVDPLMTVTVPPLITASTGMDALAHAIEAYTTRRYDCRLRPERPEDRPVYTGGNILTDSIAATSIRLIATYLRRAVNNGYDLEARRGMSLASLCAGIAFTNAGLTAVHAMSMGIGAKYHMAHGVTNALLLPYVMEYNIPSNFERFAKVAELMGETVERLSAREAAMKSSSAVRALAQDIGIPQHLSGFGAKAEDIPALAEASMKLERLIVCNPRKITTEDLQEIFRRAL